MSARATNFSALNVGARRTLPGTDIERIKAGTFTVDAASIAAGATAEQTVTVSGLTTGDLVKINAPAALEAGLTVSAERVSAADTLVFRITNTTAAPVDPASAVYSYIAFRIA